MLINFDNLISVQKERIERNNLTPENNIVIHFINDINDGTP